MHVYTVTHTQTYTCMSAWQSRAGVYRGMHEWDGFMPVKDHVQCLCLHDSKKDDEVAVPVCAQEHRRDYPTPPHPLDHGCASE